MINDEMKDVTLEESEVVIDENTIEQSIIEDNKNIEKSIESIEQVVIDENKINDVESEIVESKTDLIKEDEEKTEDLFEEFSSFLKDKIDMTEDKKDLIVIPTGIDLIDAILGGGFVVGALNIIVGQPGSGKSMLAMQTYAQGQKLCKGGMIGGYLDSEEATTKQRLSNLGVRYPKITPYAGITVEKVFKFFEGLCLFKDKKKSVDIPSIIVWDSIANTLSEKETETNDPNTVIGYKARLLSILIPKYVAKAAKYNICLLAVNQLRDVLAMGPYAAPNPLKFMSNSKSMPGGNILKYNAFQLVEMKVKSPIAPGATNDSNKYGFEGMIAKIKCVKNKLFSPNVEIEIVGSFTTGFSNFWTNYNFLKETKRLSTGAWNYLISLPDKKFRIKDAPKLYKEDKEFHDTFDTEAKNAIQIEIIDKYNPVIEEDDVEENAI